MMESACLEFVWRDGGPVLERSLVRTRDGEAIVAGPRAAVWANRVPRALALLFVRLARWQGIAAERRPALLPLLQGQGKCMAVSLSEVFTKGSQKWLGELMDNHEPPMLRLRRGCCGVGS